MIEVTFAEIAAEVKALAASRPDYVYPVAASGGCTYVDESKALGYHSPACLFGQAMLNLGVPDSELRDRNDFIRDVLSDLEIRFTNDEGNWAMRVQSAQDREIPWGVAVSANESLFPADTISEG